MYRRAAKEGGEKENSKVKLRRGGRAQPFLFRELTGKTTEQRQLRHSTGGKKGGKTPSRGERGRETNELMRAGSIASSHGRGVKRHEWALPNTPLLHKKKMPGSVPEESEDQLVNPFCSRGSLALLRKGAWGSSKNRTVST